MISEDLLKQALYDYEENKMSQLPEVEQSSHTFSEEFLRSMEQLPRKKANLRRRFTHMAACFAAVCLTASALTFCISPTARAAVISWIRGQENTYYTYRSTGGSETDDKLIYSLGYVPEGYTLFGDHSDPGHGMIVYTNEEGQLLTFQYNADTGDSALYLDPESSIHSTSPIHEAMADVYIAQLEEESSVIVWVDSKTNYLLTIMGFFSEEELLALAESAAPKQP